MQERIPDLKVVSGKIRRQNVSLFRRARDRVSDPQQVVRGY
jgi:hypothetical protein